MSDEAKKERDKIMEIEKTVDPEPQDMEKKQEKKAVLKNFYNFFEGREKVLNAFNNKIFLIETKGSSYLESEPPNFEILTLNKCFKDCQ